MLRLELDPDDAEPFVVVADADVRAALDEGTEPFVSALCSVGEHAAYEWRPGGSGLGYYKRGSKRGREEGDVVVRLADGTRMSANRELLRLGSRVLAEALAASTDEDDELPLPVAADAHVVAVAFDAFLPPYMRQFPDAFCGDRSRKDGDRLKYFCVWRRECREFVRVLDYLNFEARARVRERPSPAAAAEEAGAARRAGAGRCVEAHGEPRQHARRKRVRRYARNVLSMSSGARVFVFPPRARRRAVEGGRRRATALQEFMRARNRAEVIADAMEFVFKFPVLGAPFLSSLLDVYTSERVSLWTRARLREEARWDPKYAALVEYVQATPGAGQSWLTDFDASVLARMRERIK